MRLVQDRQSWLQWKTDKVHEGIHSLFDELKETTALSLTAPKGIQEFAVKFYPHIDKRESVKMLQRDLATLYKKHEWKDIDDDGLIWKITLWALGKFIMQHPELRDAKGIIDARKTREALKTEVEKRKPQEKVQLQAIASQKLTPQSQSQPQVTTKIETRAPETKKEEGWFDKAKKLGSEFMDLVEKKWWEVTKEVKEYFYKYAIEMPKEVVKDFLVSIEPEEVKALNKWKAKQLDRILSRKLDSEVISEQQAKTIITQHFWALETKVKTEQVQDVQKRDIWLSPEEKERREKEREIVRLYSKLRDNLRTFHKMTPEDLFTKVFIHESGGDKETRTIKVFAASWTGSLGPCQAVSGTYCNNILPEKFNPFDVNEAIPWAVAFFLLENYDWVHQIAVKKARKYAEGKPNAKKIIADAEAGKYDIYVALDRYNKWNGWSASVSLSEMLWEKKNKRYAHGNHADYADRVLRA